jgi:hypothetical protein
MKTASATSLLVLIACSWVSAADPAPVLEVKNKSTFSASGGRNPFWPIGWKKPASKINAGTEQAAPEISADAFALTSVTFDQGTHFAIINGKVMQEGQQFGLQIGTKTFQITIKSILDGRVVLQHGAEEIVLMLRRK